MDALGWLEPYIAERETTSNWSQETSASQSIIEENDDEEEGNSGEEDFDESILVSSNNSAADTPTNTGSKGEKNISFVTGREAYRKKSKRKPEGDLEADLMMKLKERLTSKKDEDQLYGDLLATKLRKLSKLNKLKVKHEIDNIIFKYELQNEEYSSIPQQPHQFANETLRSPPLTPKPSLESSSPVYQPQTNQINLPGISSFTNPLQRNQLNQGYQNYSYVNALNSEASQDQMMNGDLFRRLGEHEVNRD